MIALASGRIRISLVTQQGKELILRHVEPGTILGEMGVLDGSRALPMPPLPWPAKAISCRNAIF